MAFSNENNNTPLGCKVFAYIFFGLAAGFFTYTAYKIIDSSNDSSFNFSHPPQEWTTLQAHNWLGFSDIYFVNKITEETPFYVVYRDKEGKHRVNRESKYFPIFLKAYEQGKHLDFTDINLPHSQ